MKLIYLKFGLGVICFAVAFISIVCSLWYLFQYLKMTKNDASSKKIIREFLGPASLFIPGMESKSSRIILLKGYFCFGAGMGSALLLFWLFDPE